MSRGITKKSLFKARKKGQGKDIRLELHEANKVLMMKSKKEGLRESEKKLEDCFQKY